MMDNDALLLVLAGAVLALIFRFLFKITKGFINSIIILSLVFLICVWYSGDGKKVDNGLVNTENIISTDEVKDSVENRSENYLRAKDELAKKVEEKIKTGKAKIVEFLKETE